jgi:hypothetical protein
MAYVIYDTETTKIYRASKNDIYAPSLRAAKAALTKILNKNPNLSENLAFAEVTKFHQTIEKQVYRKNLMSGEMYFEPYNTPSYCSPASEAYWSM